MLGQLFEALKEGLAAERVTLAGRVNIIGLLLAAVIALASSVTPWFEAVVRLVQPTYTTSVDVLQIMSLFAIFALACVILLGLLEMGRR